VRVAHLVSRYPAVSHTFIRREVEGLRRRGFAVTTCSVRRARGEDLPSAADRAEAAATLALVPPSPTALAAAHARALRWPGAYLRTLAGALRAGRRHVLYFGEAVLLWHLLDRRGLRHVHVHFANNASDVALLAVALGRRTGRGPRSWSLTVHGASDLRHPERNRLAVKCADASGVVCVSDFTRAQMMAAVPPALWDRLRVARYGVALPAPRAAPRTGPGPLRVVHVARLTPVKGQAVLLDAVALLAARGVAVELTVVGDGPERARLEARAAGLPVRFLGALGEPEVARAYAGADAFALSSLYEGLPVVLLEAMSHGLAVVAPAVAAIPEVVRDGVDGLLVAPARPDALAGALERLAADAELRERLGAAARARVADAFDAERALDGVADALRAVAPA
jgi:colanic acid/amylovoran biosynthesis glycosyltransferase